MTNYITLKETVQVQEMEFGTQNNLKNGWYLIWKIHDALTEEKQGAATQANSYGNAELCRQPLFSKDIKMHHWISSWRWIKNTPVPLKESDVVSFVTNREQKMVKLLGEEQ